MKASYNFEEEFQMESVIILKLFDSQEIYQTLKLHAVLTEHGALGLTNIS